MPDTLNHYLNTKHSRISLFWGVFRGFAKAVHFTKQIFPFGCWRCCWKKPHRLHCADWGTVEIVHSKVRRSGRGRIVVWASFYPGSMAQRKGWLVCPISKCCHVFGYRDKSPTSRQREQPLSREKKKQNLRRLKWGETLGSPEECRFKTFVYECFKTNQTHWRAGSVMLPCII